MIATALDPIAQERAVQLAIIYLTRREDLHVVRSQDECQPDLMVSLLEDGLPVGKYLGVVAKAVPSDELRLIAQTLQDTHFDVFREAPFPICLFLFAMDTDKGYWTWLRRPIEITSDLTFAHTEDVMPLNNIAIESLIASVKEWYRGRGK